MEESEYLYFELIFNPEVLLDILAARMPRSAHVINMVKMHNSFITEMTFYTLNGFSDEKCCWILGTYEREDTGQQFVISIPNNLDTVDQTIKNTFATAPIEIINWDRQFEFIGTDRIVTELVSWISVQHGNSTEILPCQFFYLSREKAKEITLSSTPSSIELKSLDSVAGINYLLTARWYWNENTRVFRIKCVKRCASFGAYIDADTVVSGALVNPTGHLAITTLDSHQRQGLAFLCLQKLVHFLGTETPLIPCSMVYIRNSASLALQKKVNLEATHLCDFVFYKG